MKTQINQLHSRNAEDSVIGSLILDNHAYDRISDVLTPHDFFHVPNQIVYRHIEELAGKGQPYDVITLSDSLKDSDIFNEVGGLSYLATITKNTPTSVNIKSYAEIVRNHAIKHKLSEALSQSNELLYHSQGASEEEVLDKVEQNILSVRQEIDATDDDVIMAKNVIPDIIDYLDKLSYQENGLAGLTTGFIDLDAKLCGLGEEQLIIVAGRPAMGITSFAMNIAEAVLTKTDKSVLLFSMEMSAKDIMMRMSSSLGRLSFSKIRAADFDESDWTLLSAAFQRVEQLDV